MAINSKDLLKAGDFITRFYSGTVIVPSGATGVLFSITPPEGQRVKLDALVSGGSAQSDIEISVGETVILTGLSLESYQCVDSGRFHMNGGIGEQGALNGGGIIGGANEAITVSKTIGNTTSEIRYMYQFGE